MAFSPKSRHHSRIIREMSRDLDKTQHSCASSTGSNHGTVSDSTISDFDPENEAIMSTRQVDLNYSQNLPELRDTAKKYGRWNSARQPDIAINTSAIGRAFPDFSQGGSSDDSMSIEVGRGAKSRQRTPNQQTRPHYTENIDSPVVTIGDFQILSTPPMKPQAKSTTQQDALRSSIRKESQIKRASSVQKENVPPLINSEQLKKVPGYVSGASRTASGEQRRTLAELHARVADESDRSFMSDERPATVTFAGKSSRFSGVHSRNSPLVNSNSKKTRDLLNIGNASRYSQSQTQAQTPSKLPNNGTLNSNTFNPTNQSFLLPNMPDISELVSGTFKDGTPVFTRSGKVQSRFSSNGYDFKGGHNGLDGIPVPQEEKDIFLSLQLMQEKVESLEMEKANTQRVMEELQREVYQLEAEKKELLRHRRSDSALGMGDSGSDGENARDNQKLIAEKTSLAAQLKSVQNRLETTDRKISTLELRLKTNTAERDQAVKQLTEAFYISEELKAENESLLKENESLKIQLAQLISESEENAQRWHNKENTLRQKLQRREEAVLEIREVTREIQETHSESKVRNTSHTSVSTAGRGRKGKRTSTASETEKGVQSKVAVQPQTNRSQEFNRGRTPSSGHPAGEHHQTQERIQSRSISRSHRLNKHGRSASAKRDTVECGLEEEISGSDAGDEGSLNETTKTIHKDINVNADDDDHTQGSNYSSILGHGEMDRLRQILANERAKQQARLAGDATIEAEDVTVHSTRSVGSAPGLEPNLQRKSSTNGLAGILKNRGNQSAEDMAGHISNIYGDDGQDHTMQSNVSHRRRHSENSMHNRIKSRRPIAAEEMTSAFILPDITLHGGLHNSEHPTLSADARRVLDKLAHHDGHNCTVCARVTSFQVKENTQNIQGNQKILIVKPVPVSERMPVPGPYEDEPTMRPANTPGLALATVMKALEDELSHLKMELAQYQAMYNKHDASLGMRKRKGLKAKIENLLKGIDIKADQIYNLYDVLEGQKHSGQELSELDVEITLQSLGVDLEKLKLDKRKYDKDGNDENDDSDLDLPWEGIDDTTGTDKSGNGRRQSWRL